MKFTHLSNQRVIISRLMAYSGSGSKSVMTTVTAALGHLQPVTQEKTQLIKGVPGKTYLIFCDKGIDLQEMDQLRDEEGNIYTVKRGGVTKWQHGAMDYQEAILIRS